MYEAKRNVGEEDIPLVVHHKVIAGRKSKAAIVV